MQPYFRVKSCHLFIFKRYVERDPSTNELLSDHEDEDFITLDIAWYDFPQGVQDAGSYPPDLPITLEVEFGLYPMPEGPMAVMWEITDNQGNVLRLEPGKLTIFFGT